LVRDSGVPREVLEAEFRTIHQKHGTVEYAFSISELPSLIKQHPGEDLAVRYSTAILAFREARRERMRLYPTVRETLTVARQAGCKLVGYTESFAFYSAYRIRRLDLDLLLDAVYSPADHDLPPDVSRERVRRYPPEHYQLRGTEHHHTPSGERKPNPGILRSIVRSAGARVEDAVYIGDSLMKDVLMAQDAGVTDAWAKYGFSPTRDEYELLKRVTHWTDDDVARERSLSSRDVRPTHVLEWSFSELLNFCNFAPLSGHAVDATIAPSGDDRQ
jgi:phosphoglycolate phosphatase